VFVILNQLFNPQKLLYLIQSQPIIPISSTAPIWAQLLTVLVIGLLTAFAFQLLLTVLGIALGISVLQVSQPKSDRSSKDFANQTEQVIPSDQADQESSTAIGMLAGFGVLLTVNTVLFAACFLAAKFGQIDDPISGAIAGIVIWSAYFLLILWLSSTAMSSLFGLVLGALTGGFRKIISAIANLGSDQDVAITEEQMVSSIREEMQAALDTVDLRQMVKEQLQTILPSSSQLAISQSKPYSDETGSRVSHSAMPAVRQSITALPDLTTTNLWQEIQIYLQDTSSKSLTPKRIDRKLKKLLQAGESDLLHSQSIELDQAIAQVLDQRDDLTDKRKHRIIDQFEQTWESFLQENPSILKAALKDKNKQPESKADLFDQAEVDEADNEHSEDQHPATKLLQSALDTTVDQVLTHLPKLLQQSNSSLPKELGLAPMVLSIALTKIRDAIDTDSSTADNFPSLDYSDLKQTLERLLDSSLRLPDLNQSLITQANQLRQKAMQPIELIQQSAQERIEAAKWQTQQRLEKTRKTAAAAAWWLFLTASTGAATAALAGALAAGFVPMLLLHSLGL
jgi:hypothetical protein